MTSKITLYYDSKIHIFQTIYNEESIFIKVNDEVTETEIRLNLNQAMGLSKALDYNRFKKQSEITDEQIENHVVNHVKNRANSKNDIFFLFSNLIYGEPDAPEENQIECGVKHYKKLRDRIKSVVEKLEEKRTGTPMFFGLEDIS